jgi:hypothetical protein
MDSRRTELRNESRRGRPAIGGLAILLGGILTFSAGCGPKTPSDGKPERIRVEVSVDKLRPSPGGQVGISAFVKTSGELSLDDVRLTAKLFVPSRGARDLALSLASRELGLFKGEVALATDTPEGLYGVTVEAAAPGAATGGKAEFLVGKILADFMIISALPETGGREDAEAYMRRFKSAGGNMLVLHDIIHTKAWYPSRICASAAAPGSPDDRLGPALDLADALGLSCLITVVWDTTEKKPYAEYMAGMKAVMRELWTLYRGHPSLLGFYDYQEGSGTYFAAHVREFSDAVKALDKGLLAGCAPYIDDPLLSGYLAAIDSLDLVIYQGAVMASYRPDNRKMFPLRRTRDFAALSAGAMAEKGKIAVSHVELFGYLEKSYGGAYLASPEDALSQILSAASCFGPDGLSLFTYHYNIHVMGKTIPEVAKTALAVEEGLKAFRMLAREVATEPSHIGVYIPYSDWWTGRWSESIVPALDAFRQLGLAVEVVPFLPPKGEDVLPFYPYHLNEEQLAYLLSQKYVLVLPDIAGMQDTDSALVKAFVERGGTTVLFGPRIPFGDLFNRETLTGGREDAAKKHASVEIREPMFSRVAKGTRFKAGGGAVASWIPTAGKALAVFEDGAAAVLMNAVGKGQVVTVPLDLTSAVATMPGYVRDIFDATLGRAGLKRPFDIMGVNGDMDVCLTTGDGSPAAAVINHNAVPADVILLPLGLAPGKDYLLSDLVLGTRSRRKGSELYQLRFRVSPHGFIAIKITPE